MGERKVLVLEIGKGVDLRGEDATKAACRAVRDAVGSNGLPGLPAILEAIPGKLTVTVRLGLPEGAGAVDHAAVKELLPVGEISVVEGKGGMSTPLYHNGGNVLIVLAVVEVAVET